MTAGAGSVSVCVFNFLYYDGFDHLKLSLRLMISEMSFFQWIQAVGIVIGIIYALVKLVFLCGSYKTKIDNIGLDMKDIKSEIQALYKILLERIK